MADRLRRSTGLARGQSKELGGRIGQRLVAPQIRWGPKLRDASQRESIRSLNARA